MVSGLSFFTSLDSEQNHSVAGSEGHNASRPVFEDCSSNSDVSTDAGSDVSRSPRRRRDGAGSFARPSQRENLIIFDWDDTLLPTTWLHGQGLLEDGAVPLSIEQGLQLQALAGLVAATLDAAKKRGAVCIVTNAEPGWVEESCRAFMPSLQLHLQDVRIVSARGDHEKHGQFAPTAWKCLAFEGVVRDFCHSARDDAHLAPRRSIVSLGDSEYEMEALWWVSSGTKCHAKTLKFVRRPGLERLKEQHELVASIVDELIDHDGNLDYEVGVED
jgi:hypothetical protein